MNDLEETIYINRLLDIYGRLLTMSQLEIMQDYYQLNLSLSEIAENRNITRTAVSDTLKKGREKLDNYEEKLGICKVFDSLKKESNKEQSEVLDKVEERIKNGI